MFFCGNTITRIIKLKYKIYFMKSITSYLLVFIFLTLFSSSCEKEKDLDGAQVDAFLVWEGDYTENGCGFLLIIENQEYKPEREFLINEKYKTGEIIPVSVEYIGLNRFVQLDCSQSAELELIEIISIEERSVN